MEERGDNKPFFVFSELREVSLVVSVVDERGGLTTLPSYCEGDGFE